VKLFSCTRCEQVLFFENTVCTSCGQNVGYSQDAAALVAIPDDVRATTQVFEVKLPSGKWRRYRKCANYVEHDACNWLVNAEDADAYCRSCRLTEENGELYAADNRRAWLEIESAKRRLLYSLYALKLPVASKADDPATGLKFRFQRGTDERPVMTGHDAGLITLNIAEANAAFRENMREKMGEAYRTVLGHLRHESGHYYWDHLIRGSDKLEAFRALFGNDEESYAAALKRHYDSGPPADWRASFISEYATMHPWEDWAETWAHYLHMTDTLETARSHGLMLRIPGKKREKLALEALVFRDYQSLSTGWQAVTLALNNLNRSMGVKDAYPFVLSPRVHEKLCFVHELIAGAPARLSSNSAKTRGKTAASRRSSLFSWLRPRAPSAPSSSLG